MKRRNFSRTPVVISIAILIYCCILVLFRKTSNRKFNEQNELQRLDYNHGVPKSSFSTIALSDRDDIQSNPRILILTPVKNSANHLPHYFSQLLSLSYPSEYISIGIMDSDSTDNTIELLHDFQEKYKSKFSSNFKQSQLY